ncbi:hypothetical protein C5167_047824 [Papaver somniferum]|uniref:Cytochrome P450 n=1 Tax=Papaver somniferum TaxID=3469 RepID=A0A4Y7LK86_PAPSO|nr:hypothetical protein C5167_047824 [Papaver somniferum]
MVLKNGERSSSKLPPGPRRLPLIGNLHNMVGLVPHRSLRNLAKKYGPIMHLQLGEVPILVVSSPSVAKQIMKTHDLVFADRPEIYAAKIMLYDCSNVVFSRYGDYWREMRKIFVLHLLSAKHVPLFRPLREEEVKNTIKSISLQAGVRINLSKRITSLFNTITSRAAFGDKCKVNEEVISMMRESLTLVGGLEDLFPSLKLLHRIGGMKSKLLGLHQEVDKFLERVIQEHRKSRMVKIDDGELEEEDLVDALLRVQESGELSLTTQNIKAVIWEIFGAGTDTSAIAILWAMSELLKNQRVMEKVQTEIRQVFGGKKQIDETDTSKLEYLKLVIKETLRLHPPAPLTLRESRERCEIDGYDIPAKTKMIVNVWALGRDAEYWSNADAFEPERFDGNTVDYKGNNFEYIPFGAGRRMCPGMSFAMANVELTLAHLLYYFEWKIVDELKTSEELDMIELFEIGINVTQLLSTGCPFDSFRVFPWDRCTSYALTRRVGLVLTSSEQPPYNMSFTIQQTSLYYGHIHAVKFPCLHYPPDCVVEAYRLGLGTAYVASLNLVKENPAGQNLDEGKRVQRGESVYTSAGAPILSPLTVLLRLADLNLFLPFSSTLRLVLQCGDLLSLRVFPLSIFPVTVISRPRDGLLVFLGSVQGLVVRDDSKEVRRSLLFREKVEFIVTHRQAVRARLWDEWKERSRNHETALQDKSFPGNTGSHLSAPARHECGTADEALMVVAGEGSADSAVDILATPLTPEMVETGITEICLEMTSSEVALMRPN